jgi:steroid 5-alpha reductase family enzyme
MSYYLSLIVFLFVYMNFWFIASLIKKRNDLADLAWGLGFVSLAWLSFFLSENSTLFSLIVNFLITVWGLRLFNHIFKRIKNKKEDYRYQAWREKWGKLFFIRSYFQVFILQGVFLFIIASSVLFINKNNLQFSLFFLLGLIVWLIGFIFESISDKQLSEFIKNPTNQGKILKTGLWKHSRHPNYFGETVQWWGIWLIGLSLTNGWLLIISPITITVLILFVSGIPLLEKKMAEQPEFEEYKKTTSVFFPLPPRKI